MYRRHGQKLTYVFLACDLAVTSAVWFVAYWLRFAYWPSPDGTPDLATVAEPLPIVLGLAAVAYRLSGLYEIHRLQQLPRELGVVLKAASLMFLLAITATFFRRELYESRLALALFFALNTCGLLFTRRLIWQMLAWLRRRGLNHGRAVIVGAGRTGRTVAEVLFANHWTGLEPVGFVDEPSRNEPELLPRLGNIDQLAQVILEHDVDHVFVALPLSRYQELPYVYQQLTDVVVEVQLVPDIPDLAGMRIRMLEISGVPFLGLRENPLFGWRWYAKRTMDVVCAALLIVVASPLLALLALFVKLTSRGPILFRQPRAGLAGRNFDMLKFRTMRLDAECASGPVWASRNDNRCTPIGGLLRKWSLDELPQLFNVLAGDMSLVGPRPERPFFIDKFRKEIPNYSWRHQVKAGITGWAQVNGWRGNTSLRRRVEYDLYYINHWSLWLDIQILWMTLWTGMRHRNAY